FVGLLLGVRRATGRDAGGRPTRRQVLQLTAAALLVSTNWLVYVWAVAHDRVVAAALGYYINPLLTVALGVFVLGEHPRGTPPLQLLCGVVVFGEELPPARLAGFVLVWAALVVLAADATQAGRSARTARQPAPELV